jgi:hypothetical protein
MENIMAEMKRVGVGILGDLPYIDAIIKVVFGAVGVIICVCAVVLFIAFLKGLFDLIVK